MAELLADQRQPHELVVLVPVADDQVIGLVGERDDRLQLGLGSAFETDAVGLAEFVDLLHNVTLLIDLDREDGRVLAGVAVLFDRRFELFAQLMHARAQQIGEPEQHRHGDALRFQILRQLEQIHFAVRMIAIRTHDDVSAGVDIEVAASPSLDVVQGAGVIDGPRHGSARGGFRRKRQGCHARNSSVARKKLAAEPPDLPPPGSARIHARTAHAITTPAAPPQTTTDAVIVADCAGDDHRVELCLQAERC